MVLYSGVLFFNFSKCACKSGNLWIHFESDVFIINGNAQCLSTDEPIVLLNNMFITSSFLFLFPAWEVADVGPSWVP